jgi:hypothetical protein
MCHSGHFVFTALFSLFRKSLQESQRLATVLPRPLWPNRPNWPECHSPTTVANTFSTAIRGKNLRFLTFSKTFHKKHHVPKNALIAPIRRHIQGV